MYWFGVQRPDGGFRLGLPDDYFLFDIETTGFDREYDLIVQVGWGVVVGRRLQHTGQLVLDWSTHPQVDQAWLRFQLSRIHDEMAASGRNHSVPYDRMQREGVDPYDGLHVAVSLLSDYLGQGGWVAGHGLWNFDRTMLDGQLENFFPGVAVPWHCGQVLDTGMFEKASQLARLPWSGESLAEWYGKIDRTHASVTWNLDQHCVQKYDLARRFGVDPRQAHGADYDCRIGHAVVETFRELTEVTYG